MIATLRGLALVIWTYGLMAVMGVVTLPIVTLRPTLARTVARLYVRLVLGGARLIGLFTGDNDRKVARLAQSFHLGQ